MMAVAREMPAAEAGRPLPTPPLWAAAAGPLPAA